MTDYRDSNNIDPNGNYTITQLIKFIREKMYGIDVRESIASGLEAMSEDVVNNTERQDTVETQFQQVIDETTGKDVISAPEIIDARNGEPNLKTRLDDEHAQVTAQLQQTTIQVSVEEPTEARVWYEDRGEAPINFESTSGVSVQNAQISKSEPTDTQKLWFDKN